ncbi:uncharacterized protein LOC127794515 [Diospyros lotus]|uniref:uncharacterized protein LOC127794515 n=1 Tax=Diospyros lotus TaxID=55363 RepID=UPI00224F8C3A|nr:uncharacterized protein LOC127794515 [Diospyros lotus]
MEWCHKMVFPVRRLWIAVAAKVKARDHVGGLLKLRDDIQSCGYKDVEVMWEMLRGSDSEMVPNRLPKRKHRPFWRVLTWSKPS